MQVQMMLLVNADQNTLSANSARKLSSPAKVGVEMPSQLKNAKVIVSSAGTRTMTKLMISVGTRKSRCMDDCFGLGERRPAPIHHAFRSLAGSPWCLAQRT